MSARPTATADAKLAGVLCREREAVIGRSALMISRLHGSHYDEAGAEPRLARLYDHVLAAASRRDLGPIVAYAQRLATDRYEGGYPLPELLVAFNALEQALWEALVDDLAPQEVATALTLVSSIFGVAKDTLACSYVAAATRTRTKALDVESLAAGLASA